MSGRQLRGLEITLSGVGGRARRTTRWSHTRGPSPKALDGSAGLSPSLAARLNLFVMPRASRLCIRPGVEPNGMRTLLVLSGFLFIWLLGCTASQPQPSTAEHLDIINPVPVQELEQAKRKFHLLPPELTPEQVFGSLGLSKYYGKCLGQGGGPTSSSWVSYTLRNGHDLHLVFNASGLLILATLDDAAWKGDYHPIRRQLLRSHSQ
jgi:hypothetical protein